MCRSYMILPFLVAGGLVSFHAHAQELDETGIVRVTDSAEVAHDLGFTVEGECPDCQYGTCPDSYGYGNPCNRPGRLGTPVIRFLSWLNPRGACTHSPGHGWAPPTKDRVYRRSIAYTKQFPDQWTGMQTAHVRGPAMPPVYTPTDTTQLGYYYQHVPRWWPRQGMIPGVPNPNDWHISSCQGNHCPAGQYCRGAACPHCQHGHAGQVIHSPIEGDSQGEELTPTPIEETTEPSVPVTPPAPETPPAPAEVNGLERADGTPSLQQIR